MEGFKKGFRGCKGFRGDNGWISGLVSINNQPPLIQLIISLLVIIVAGTLLFYLLILLGSFIFQVSPERMVLFPAPENGIKETIILKYIQVSQQISMFLVPSIIAAGMLKKGDESILKVKKVPGLLTVLLVIILAILIIPVTTYTGMLNSWMELPDSLSGIENWMRVKEEEASDLTDLLITSDGLPALFANLVILAAIPALAEEFIFRGVLQQLFCRLFRSAHAGIFITAILFSAIHFQFYGFLPRLILGLGFGYLFYWTGTIWVSVTAHFVNNATLVIIAFQKGWEPVGDEVLKVRQPEIAFPVIPVILCCLILLYFWYNFKRINTTPGKYH